MTETPEMPDSPKRPESSTPEKLVNAMLSEMRLLIEQRDAAVDLASANAKALSAMSRLITADKRLKRAASKKDPQEVLCLLNYALSKTDENCRAYANLEELIAFIAKEAPAA